MVERRIEHLTLRELFTDTDRLVRELIDHLDHNQTPKANRLVRLVRPTESEPFPSDVSDVTVRNRTRELIESEEFSDELYKKLAKYCSAIDDSVQRIVSGE